MSYEDSLRSCENGPAVRPVRSPCGRSVNDGEDMRSVGVSPEPDTTYQRVPARPDGIENRSGIVSSEHKKHSGAYSVKKGSKKGTTEIDKRIRAAEVN